MMAVRFFIRPSYLIVSVMLVDALMDESVVSVPVMVMVYVPFCALDDVEVVVVEEADELVFEQPDIPPPTAVSSKRAAIAPSLRD